MPIASLFSGTLAFQNENDKSVTFSQPLSGTDYQVQLSPGVLTPLRVYAKTTTGFRVQAGATITGNVSYDVFE